MTFRAKALNLEAPRTIVAIGLVALLVLSIPILIKENGTDTIPLAFPLFDLAGRTSFTATCLTFKGRQALL